MIRVPCGQSRTSAGSIHGCIAVGSNTSDSRSSARDAIRTLSWNASARPESVARGPLHLSSTTCSASSLFHAMSPFSHSSVSSPATLSSNRSAAGTASSVSSETIMYSSSIPTASKSRYGLLRGVLRDSGLLCGIDAHLEHFHDPVVKLVAEHRVLDAVVEVRIVVDLDQHGASVHLLDVDAVEPVADRVRGSEREIDDLARCLLHGQGLRIALLRPFRAVM